MKKNKKIIAFIMIIFMFCLNLYSYNSYLKNKGVIINLNEYKTSFGIGFTTDAFEKVNNFKEGTVNRFSDDPDNITNLGIFVEIKVEYEKNIYYVLYCMLSELNKEIKENNIFKQNDYIGKTGPSGPLSKIFKDSNIFIAVYTFEKNVVLDKLSNSSGFLQHGVCWYNPSFVINKKVSDPVKNNYDEKSYKKIKFNEFINFFNETPGESYYGLTKLQTIIEVQNFPVKIDDKDIGNIKKVCSNAKINDEKFMNLYKYKIILTYPSVVEYKDKCRLILYIQSELVPFIKNEYKINDKMKINFIISYVNTFDQEMPLLVTGIDSNIK